MDTYVLHDTDYDGRGAAYAAWKKFGDDAEYIALDHRDAREGPPTDQLPSTPARIYILDYSWDIDQLLYLGQAHEVTVIDHHPSFYRQVRAHQPARRKGPDPDHSPLSYEGKVVGHPAGAEDDDRVGLFDVVYNSERSAATLSWMYFHQSEPPRLLKHIEDRDLWNWDMEHTDAVLKGLDVEGTDPETIDVYVGQEDRLLATGTAVCGYRDGLVGRLVEDAAVGEVDFRGDTYQVAYANAPVLRSKVGHELLEKFPDVDFSLVYSTDGLPEGTIGISLRSTDDRADVSKIAEAHGGGGMSNAAGCKAEFEPQFEENGALFGQGSLFDSILL